MSGTCLWYPESFCILDPLAPNTNDHSSGSVAANQISLSYNPSMLVKFSVPSVLRGKTITNALVYISVTAIKSQPSHPNITVWLKGSRFDPLTATYNNCQFSGSDYMSNVISITGLQALTLPGTTAQAAIAAARYGLSFRLNHVTVNTPASSGVFLNLSYEDAAQIVTVTGKTIDPAKETLLLWSISGGTIAPLNQNSAVLTYKKAGSETEYTVPISGSATECTIPADTFTVGTSKYKVSCTLEDGSVVESGWADITVNSIAIDGATPTSGYARNEDAVTFSWDIKRSVLSSQVSPAITGGALEWKNGSSGTVHSINTGTAKTVTVPANTFPDTATLMWRLAGVTTAAGDSYNSDWYTLTTLESLSSAVVVSPKNVTVDGSEAIKFDWEHVIATGTPPTGYELLTSRDGTSFTQLAAASTGSATEYTAPANTFTAGKLWWKVRTKNTDGIAGSYSTVVEVTVICAPATPAISIISAAPRFEIRWQGSGQQAFELRIDGEVYACRFGSEGRYAHDDYLSDGPHTVEVRMQNSYALWSDWGRAALTVVNSAGAVIDAEASKTGLKALIVWTTAGEYSAFWVLRNGEKIGVSAGQSFTDPFGLGDCEYKVLGVIANSGNYGLSNSAGLSIMPNSINVTDVKTHESVDLDYSESQVRTTGFRLSREAKYTHFSGQALPEVELGEALDKAYDFSCALDEDMRRSAATFEAMFGRLVCIRDCDGVKLFGALDAVNIRSDEFSRRYSATVRAVGYREGAG